MKTSHLVSFSTAFGLTMASTVMSILLFSTLPGKIPTHFGLSGTPDAWANKDLVFVFMIPALQLLIFFLFVLIYRHPQYMSWPTTMLLLTVDKDHREKVFEILRSMLSAHIFAISILFTYIQFTIFATANDRLSGLNPYLMGALVAFLFGIIIFYNAKIYVLVHKIVKK